MISPPRAKSHNPVRMLVRIQAEIVARPAEAYTVLRMVGWACVLPGLKYVVPLPRLARWMWKPSTGARNPAREARTALWAFRIFRAAETPTRGRCLERSLLLYRFLSEVGADPVLVVALNRGASQTGRGHAWVEVGGHPVGEGTGTLTEFIPMATFGRGGRMRPHGPKCAGGGEAEGGAVAPGE